MLSLIASMATGPRSDLPIIEIRPVLLQHHAGELVHAGGGGGAGRADHFITHRIDRADVVDDAVGEVDRQLLALGQHVGDALVAASRPVSILPLSSSFWPGFQAATSSLVRVSRSTRVADVEVRRPGDGRPVFQFRRVDLAGPEPSRWKWQWRVAAQLGTSATGRLAAWGVVQHLDVEHGGQAAEALGADPQRVDLSIQLEAQFFGAVARWRRALSSWMSTGAMIDSLASSIAFRRAADADADDARRAPAGAHGRDRLEHPIDQVVGGIEHRELGLAFGAAALGADDLDVVAGRSRNAPPPGCCPWCSAGAGRVGEHRGAQRLSGLARRGARPRRSSLMPWWHPAR